MVESLKTAIATGWWSKEGVARHPVLDHTPELPRPAGFFDCLETEWQSWAVSWAIRSLLKSSTFCPVCVEAERIERSYSLSRTAGITCLKSRRGVPELTYVGVNGRYAFRRLVGHTGKLKAPAFCAETDVSHAEERTVARGSILHARWRTSGASTEYIRADVKMHWLCHRGRAWWTKFSNIRIGHWCPECAWLVQSTKKKTRRKYEAVEGPDISSAPPEKNHTV